MALEQKLQLKIMQKLILTPQLQQAIKLLQLPQLELSQMINQELVENPFLEETSEELAGESPPEENAGNTEQPETNNDQEPSLEKILDFSVDEYFDSRSYDGRDLGYFTPDTNPIQSFEKYVSQGNDLYDHLTWQIRLTDTDDEVKAAAEAVIGNIDENGYLQSTAEEIAVLSDCSRAITEKAIATVQTLDPHGVGARDLKECLLIQIRHLGLEGTLVEDLICNNLGDIEGRKLQQMASEYKCPIEEIKHALKVIEGLEPRPGGGMTGSQPIFIKPDAYVVRDGEDYRIVLSDDNMPVIRINNYYKKILSQKSMLKKEEKEYLTERLRSAVWLLKSLDHRNKTIYRVTESILNFQREFFENGVSDMKPLNLKDVAHDLNMHESTISRATSNKYLSCEHGLFNYRFFFSSGIRSSNGSVSSNSVKELIRKIIIEEDQKKPLSDQKIADVIKSMDISVARRTVAKYRDEMNISPQNIRKRID
jgi:RNA polymerase sigma-54 factor